jgi:MFS family permease
MARKWWTLLTVCLGMLMLLMDITIVNVAVPSIAGDLGASFSDLQWTIDAYALSLAALLLVAGSLGDLLGHRRVFTMGVVFFIVSSLICGLTTSPVFLIASRAAQGVGGAAMFASSLALLAAEFTGRDRGVALGAWGATAGGAVAVGPLVGGALTSGIGWRWVFFVNVPVGVVTLVLTLARVAQTRRRPSRPDWAGAATFGGALLAVFVVLEAVQREPMLLGGGPGTGRRRGGTDDPGQPGFGLDGAAARHGRGRNGSRPVNPALGSGAEPGKEG